MTIDLKSVLEFQYATTKRWALAIRDGLEPGDWLRRSAGTKNHAHWIYGHITVSSDIAPGIVAVQPLIPEVWRGLFDQGTQPDPEGAGYPSPQELGSMIERTMDRNLEIVAGLDIADLAGPPLIAVDESVRKFLRTRERWLTFAPLHLSYHLGQIRLIQRTLHPETKGL